MGSYEIIAEYVIKGVILLCVIFFTKVLVPFINSKTNEYQRKELWNLICSTVDAAEQIFSAPGTGNKKKEYVINVIQKAGWKITEEELDALIEAAVWALKKYGTAL